MTININIYNDNKYTQIDLINIQYIWLLVFKLLVFNRWF